MKLEIWLLAAVGVFLGWCFVAMIMTEPVQVRVDEWEMQEYHAPAYGPEGGPKDPLPVNLAVCGALVATWAALDVVLVVWRLIWPDRQ